MNSSESSTYRPIPEKSERTRGWVVREVERLDPETDYNRIMHLIAEWEYTEFAMNLGYCVQFQHVMIPVPGSDVLTGTGKVMNRKQTRFFDSAEFATTFMIKGADHPDTQRAIERLNAIHAGVAKKFPASFEENDDWLYTFCFLIGQTDRMRDLVGAPRQSRNRQIAVHHFWRDIAAGMRGPNGEFYDFPETYDDAIAFLDEFESRDWAYTPKGKQVSDAIIEQFNQKYFPRPFYPVGRAMILAFVNETVRERHRIPRVNPLLMRGVRAFFRKTFVSQEKGAERKTPFSEELAADKWKARRTEARRTEHTVAQAHAK